MIVLSCPHCRGDIKVNKRHPGQFATLGNF